MSEKRVSDNIQELIRGLVDTNPESRGECSRIIPEWDRISKEVSQLEATNAHFDAIYEDADDVLFEL